MNTESGYAEKEQRLRDKAVETSLALWGALLTVNGVLISVFSVLSIFLKTVDIYSSALIGTCLLSGVISVMLLIWNFTAVKNLYIMLGQLVTDPEADLTEAKRKSDIDNAQKQYQQINSRELAVKWLLVFEGGLIIFVFIRQVILQEL